MAKHTPKVYVVVQEPHIGGGSFEWFYDKSHAELEFARACAATPSESKLVHLAEFGVKSTDGGGVTEEVEELLMKCDYTPSEFIRRECVQ